MQHTVSVKQNCEVVKEHRLIEGEKGVREKCESNFVNSFFNFSIFEEPPKNTRPLFFIHTPKNEGPFSDS